MAPRSYKPQSTTPKAGYGLEIAKNTSTHKEFPADYIQGTFVLWYDAQKPTAEELWPVLKEQNPKMCPSVKVLHTWIVGDFVMKALELDHQVERRFDETLIERKLDMLNRQAELGRRMQEMAMEYLIENGVGSSRNAIMLLKEGLDTEREAMSVPRLLKGLVDKTDAGLLEELRELVSGDPDIIDLLSTDENDQPKE